MEAVAGMTAVKCCESCPNSEETLSRDALLERYDILIQRMLIAKSALKGTTDSVDPSYEYDMQIADGALFAFGLLEEAIEQLYDPIKAVIKNGKTERKPGGGYEFRTRN